MKKKLLVLGDSFMRPDPYFPGQHWSEMLPEYEIIMYSQSGSTNGMIANQFYKGLKQNPDGVIIGFSAAGRFEFPPAGNWKTSSNLNINSEQKLTADLFKIHSCPDMEMFKSCLIARSILSTCEHRRIPYVWTLNLLFNNLADLPYPSDPTVKETLGDFLHSMTTLNLATYQKFKEVPGFHVDDPEWQKRFAQEARQILQMS